MEKSEEAYRQAGIITNTKYFGVDTRKYQYAIFESLSQMDNQIREARRLNLNDMNNSDTAKYFELESDWAHGDYETYENVSKAIHEGSVDAKVLQEVEKLRETMLDKTEVKEMKHHAITSRKRRVFSECGSELDIDRVLCGDPEHWSNMTPGKQSKVFKLGANICINAGFSKEEIQKIASWGIVTCELLTMAGFNVEFYGLDICARPTRKTAKAGHIFKLKGAEEKLDIQKISQLGLTSLVRCYGFAVIDSCLDGEVVMGYGRAEGLDDNIKEMLGMDYIIDSESTEEEVLIEIGNLIKPKEYAN